MAINVNDITKFVSMETGVEMKDILIKSDGVILRGSAPIYNRLLTIIVGAWEESMSKRGTFTIALEQCFNPDDQQKYVEKLITAYTSPKSINEITIIRTNRKPIRYCDLPSGIVYIPAKSAYQMTQADNSLLIAQVHCNFNNTYQNCAKYAIQNGRMTIEDIDIPAWARYILHPSRLYKSPKNKKYWDKVNYLVPDNGYYGENVVVVPGAVFIRREGKDWEEIGRDVFDKFLNGGSYPQNILDEYQVYQNLRRM